eukprot:TRINITY_DN2688_c0_g2_i2.p1 TRINITY_DN2688_c0_g2~~TRINITY_DN2688_c0_g2_i2.p1  ORF type:complete len:308 (+),score=86.38 TRINITY_DN2688_c0_g2_i2:30-953(+)
MQEEEGKSTQFNTQHVDMIHDAQLDYYGKRLATCSSDRSIKIFEVFDKQQKLVAELKGHEGPVWQISWAHPQFGNIIASCSYDRKVIIWKEEQKNQWKIQGTPYENHNFSVNSVQWAPRENGLVLACGSSDGRVSVIHFNGNNPALRANETVVFTAHKPGVNSISWSPSVSLLGSTQSPQGRLVTGGCDNVARIWTEVNTKEWKESSSLEHHSDWVRDVAWAPNIGLPTNTIATASQDKTVVVWREKEKDKWEKIKIINFNNSVPWRVSWSITGSILAVSTDENKVHLYKESLEGWDEVKEINDQQL